MPSENGRSGSESWFAYPRGLAPVSRLAVWASPYSPRAGDTVEVFIHADSTRGVETLVRVQLFRLGWYGSHGARRVWQRRDIPAGKQVACGKTTAGAVTCPWTRTLQIPLDPTLVSGLYLIKVTNVEGLASFYPIVVRDGRRAAIVAVIPVLTWQAYNYYGGASLYTRDYTSPSLWGRAVSFERPYMIYGGAGMLLDQRGGDKELAAIRFLERHGYDVTYITDADLDVPGDPVVDDARALVFLGHSEYWSWAMYDRVEALRDSRHHLAFLSGNNAYWNVRLLPGPRLARPRSLVLCDKTIDNPNALTLADRTGRFRELGRPENGLYGVMFEDVSSDDGVWAPLVVADSGRGPEAAAFLAAAGLSAGDQVPGLVGAEGDEIVDNGSTPAGLQILFRSPTTDQGRGFRIYATTFFIAPSGAGVFASGTNVFPQALDPVKGNAYDARIERLMAAILDWMLAR